MLDMLRYEGVTPLFVDMVPASASAGTSFDPSTYLVGFDNVVQLLFEQDEGGARPCFRVFKSVGNDFVTEPVSIEWRRS